MLISMDAKAATNMLAISTVLGLVPALLSTNVASRLSMVHFDNAAAKVKPPSRSMMTGVHMAAKMAVVASLEPRRLCGLPGVSSRTTFKRTERKGIKSDVTNKGRVCRLASYFS